MVPGVHSLFFVEAVIVEETYFPELQCVSLLDP